MWELCQLAAEGAGALLLTDEALDGRSIQRLLDLLNQQPPWSDLPLLLLVSNEASAESLLQCLGSRANVTILERPIHLSTFSSAAQAAISARRRQYQIRSLLEELERADRLKDEFLATVSHELRTPLNSILGWNQLLRLQRGDDPEIAKVAETIERSGKAQLQLIEDLLDTARIISGKMKLEFQPVDPVAIISAALNTMRPVADNKGVAITMDLDPEAGQITGDPDRLQQVVWNLMSNAIKFTPGGGRVRVELRRGSPGVRIAVQDTGQGINPDLLPYVFDRFKQGDSAASRRYGGLGLGLALVKHLVELHGGSVAVESQGEGHGATFIINLPVRAVKGGGGTESQREGETVVTPRLGRRTRALRLKGVRALVVDDEPGARELLTATLEQYGVLVTGVDSAEAALAALESRFGDEASEPFDILISDIGMPGADGYELIQRVRTHEDRRVNRIRAIALTAYARSQDRLRALQAGFQMHVPKPVDEEELTTVIATLTDRIEARG
jgi:signal transduction histidine kinase/ActR/RegA family two-component response regulator